METKERRKKGNNRVISESLWQYSELNNRLEQKIFHNSKNVPKSSENEYKALQKDELSIHRNKRYVHSHSNINDASTFDRGKFVYKWEVNC